MSIIQIPNGKCYDESYNPPKLVKCPSGYSTRPTEGLNPQNLVATMTTKYRLFLGSPKADIKSNVVYIATSAIGAFVGWKVAKKKKNLGAVIGIGAGLASGMIINAITNKL